MFNEICPPNSTQHVVKKGDTLWKLSQAYGASIQSIIDANPGINANNLQIGSILCIPEVATPPISPHACPNNSFSYIVHSGDTLWKLSQIYGVSVQSILNLNPGVNPQNLQIGSTICIPTASTAPIVPAPLKPAALPTKTSPSTMTVPPVTCPKGSFSYTIQAGDTLWKLSQIYGVSVQSIFDLNPGINPQNLQIGSTICIPTASTAPIVPTVPAPLIPTVPPISPAPMKPTVPPTKAAPMMPTAPSTMKVPPVTCPKGSFSYTIQAGDTLWKLSQIYGVSVQSILDLNPGINPQNLQIGSTICIPTAPIVPITPSVPAPLIPTVPPISPAPMKPTVPPTKAAPMMPTAPSTMKVPPVTCPKGSFSYTIQAGDTLWQLSQIYGVSVQSILDLNPGINPQNLQIGSIICIPTAPIVPITPTVPAPLIPTVPPTTVSSPRNFEYLIKKCDTICGIARKFYVSVESILRENPQINPRCLRAGMCIYVPINCCGENTWRYTVRAGDTLNRIGNKLNVCPSAIIAANPNIDFRHLIHCQVICIPKE